MFKYSRMYRPFKRPSHTSAFLFFQAREFGKKNQSNRKQNSRLCFRESFPRYPAETEHIETTEMCECRQGLKEKNHEKQIIFSV